MVDKADSSVLGESVRSYECFRLAYEAIRAPADRDQKCSVDSFLPQFDSYPASKQQSDYLCV